MKNYAGQFLVSDFLLTLGSSGIVFVSKYRMMGQKIEWEDTQQQAINFFLFLSFGDGLTVVVAVVKVSKGSNSG